MATTAENNKRIAKNTLLLYVRMLLTMAVTLYTSRVVLATLGETDYGIYNVVGGFVTMFAIISGAMTTATQRFLSFEIGKGEKGNIQSLFSTAVIIHIILAIIILLIAETAGVWFLNNYMNFPADRYVAANWVFQFSVLAFLINVISVPYNAAIIAYERMATFAYVSIIDVSLKLIIVYLLVITGYDKLITYAVLLAVIAITIRIIYGIYCNHCFPQCNCNFKWNKKHGMKMLSFVSWNMIGSISSITKEQGVNILLNIFFGATVNAARGIAYQAHAINGFVNNFQMAMNPQIIKDYASGKKEEMFKLVFRGSKFSFLMLLTLSLPVIIETSFILKFWLKEVPEYTVIFLRLILITGLVDSLSGTLITSMHASGKVKYYQIIVGGISLLTLPIVYILFKLNNPPYIAMCVSLCISIICHFARLALLKKTIGLAVGTFLKQVTFKVMAIAFLASIMPLLIYYQLKINWASFIFVCCISVLSSAFFSYLLGLDRIEKDFVLEKTKKIFKHIKK
ncbi:oligosaccharide flippase family protein [Phocaeicola sp.]